MWLSGEKLGDAARGGAGREAANPAREARDRAADRRAHSAGTQTRSRYAHIHYIRNCICNAVVH